MMVTRVSPAEIQELADLHVQERMDHTELQPAPVAIVLAGQSGAGKSTVARDLAEKLEMDGGYINVDADEMRARLPYVGEMDAEDPDHSRITQKDAGALANAVLDHAIRARRNVLIDGTLRDRGAAVDMTQRLREAGYEVELHALAVNEQISYERATRRYESERSDGRAARLVPKAHHDESYRGSAESVRHLEYTGSVDRLVVYNRLGDAIHDAEPISGKSVGAAKLDRARDQMTSYERLNLAQRWDEIAESMERRRAPASEWEQVRPALERAHYSMRMSPEASNTYDHDTPSEKFRSVELRDAYGKRLREAFSAGDRHAAAQMPELVPAFAHQAAFRQYAASNQSNVPSEKLLSAVDKRIANALENGDALKSLQVRTDIEVQQTHGVSKVKDVEHER